MKTISLILFFSSCFVHPSVHISSFFPCWRFRPVNWSGSRRNLIREIKIVENTSFEPASFRHSLGYPSKRPRGGVGRSGPNCVFLGLDPVGGGAVPRGLHPLPTPHALRSGGRVAFVEVVLVVVGSLREIHGLVAVVSLQLEIQLVVDGGRAVSVRVVGGRAHRRQIVPLGRECPRVPPLLAGLPFGAWVALRPSRRASTGNLRHSCVLQDVVDSVGVRSGSRQRRVKVLRMGVHWRPATVFDVFLQQKLVGGCDVIVLVGFKALCGLVYVQPLHFELLQDIPVDRHRIEAQDYPFLPHLFVLVKPDVLADVVDGLPFGRVSVEDVLQHVFSLGSDEVGTRLGPLEYLFLEGCRVWVLEGQLAADHSEHYHSSGPDIHVFSLVLLPSNHLGGRLAGTATSGLQRLSRPVGVRQPEVNDFDVVALIEQEILGLQIAMDDVQFVDVLNPLQYLLLKLGGFLLLDPLISDNLVEQLASTGKLHDQLQLLGRLDDFLELDYVGVAYQLQDVDLTRHSLDVSNVCYPFFFKNFDCHLFTR